MPTPLKENYNPDLSHIKNTMQKMLAYLGKGKLLILESSTYPGSTKELMIPFLKKFNIGKDFFLGYSPEREDPNNKKFTIENITKICGGYSSILVHSQLIRQNNKESF